MTKLAVTASSDSSQVAPLTCSSCRFLFVGVRPVIRHSTVRLLSLFFYTALCCWPLLCAFLAPLPFLRSVFKHSSHLRSVFKHSSHLRSVFKHSSHLGCRLPSFCNILVSLAQIFSLISRLSFLLLSLRLLPHSLGVAYRGSSVVSYSVTYLECKSACRVVYAIPLSRNSDIR